MIKDIFKLSAELIKCAGLITVLTLAAIGFCRVILG